MNPKKRCKNEIKIWIMDAMLKGSRVSNEKQSLQKDINIFWLINNKSKYMNEEMNECSLKWLFSL